jgi:hypothetical protein
MEEQKKTFNKKLLVFGVFGLFALALVSAIAYYTLFSVTFSVTPAISIEGDTTCELTGEYFAGEDIVGNEITLTNNAPSERTITITDDSTENISVRYVSELTLAQKVVDFNLDKWELLSEGNTAVVEYTLVGDEFSAEVIEGKLPDYVLVYYKDNSERFNSPATAIGIDSIIGNLPYEDDANTDEYNYCLTEEYVTCHGAKIWYVPISAIDESGNVNWGIASDFLFETELIQFNSNGEIVIYPSQTLIVTPIYTPGDYTSGEYTIETTIA